MTTENEVKIDITANDQASAVIVEAAKNAEAAMKKVEQEQKKLDTARREAFRDTKASTEFFGTIANLAGGSELASVASQMAGLTEKSAQFSEVAKSGGAAALAFKAGIVAAAGALSFQLGKALGDSAFETERWNRELERADKAAAKLEQRRLSQIAQQMADFRTGLEFTDDPDAAIEERIAMLNTEIENLNQSLPIANGELEKLYQRGELNIVDATSANPLTALKETASFASSFVDDQQRLVQEKEREISATESTLELRRQEKQELERMLGIEKERAKTRQEMAEAQGSASFIQSLQEQLVGLQSELNGTMDLTAMLKNTVAADRDSALALMEEIEATREAIKARDEAAREKQRIADEEKREKQRIADEEKRQKQQMADAEKREQERIANLKQNELDRLQEELILLEKGKEAARAFRLEKQGLSAAEAAEIAAAEATIEQLKQKPVSDTAKIGTLQARESRLLTKSFDAVDPTVSVAKNTEQQVKSQERTNVLMADLKTLLQQLLDKPPVELEVVS